ncbi:molecular chaperone Hsp20 [Sorangium cellulosum]|jgi:HSP20 family molecular chaperone IbpA|uniref:Molecular chaperone Hsp20 n=1 Tax=Sorangium cellulosum TaxID=56 RepID=A0A4P2PUW5_SORCE|nr:Hsp20/alpha crystallin family protein [Sorangium cellulosum]AUX20193.1 molecular chaperone Hsp20 [Sorangium cellulosum]
MSTDRSLTHRPESAPEKIQQRPAVPPAVDIYENAEELLVVADLPGVAQEHLAVRLEKGELTFEGRRTEAAEREQGADNLPDYRRSFVVPQGIDADKISAELQAGVLRIHLPKSASLKPRQIPITAS